MLITERFTQAGSRRNALQAMRAMELRRRAANTEPVIIVLPGNAPLVQREPSEAPAGVAPA